MIIHYMIPVHPFQVDFGGVVSNTIYIQWMEIGRTRLQEETGWPIEEAWEAGQVPVVVHTSIDYKRPYRLGDTVYADLWISELTPAKARIQHRFRDAQGVLHAKGEQLVLFASRTTLKPLRLPPEKVSLYAPFVDAPDADAAVG